MEEETGMGFAKLLPLASRAALLKCLEGTRVRYGTASLCTRLTSRLWALEQAVAGMSSLSMQKQVGREGATTFPSPYSIIPCLCRM